MHYAAAVQWHFDISLLFCVLLPMMIPWYNTILPTILHRLYVVYKIIFDYLYKYCNFTFCTLILIQLSLNPPPDITVSKYLQINSLYIPHARNVTFKLKVSTWLWTILYKPSWQPIIMTDEIHEMLSVLHHHHLVCGLVFGTQRIHSHTHTSALSNYPVYMLKAQRFLLSENKIIKKMTNLGTVFYNSGKQNI